jgi:murein peptide amidase A
MGIQILRCLCLPVVFLAALWIAGCQAPGGPQAPAVPAARQPYHAGIAGWSVKNRPVMYRVYGHGDNVVLLMAGIHGNEAAGVPILERLGRELMARPELLEGRTVVILPRVNPDGVKANQRRNAHGVDLNRNFPADNFDAEKKGHGEAPLSQPETRAVLKQIERHKPSRIVTFHQPLSCVDYDGEGAQAIAEAMGEHTDLPVKRLGGRPGSLGSYFGIDRGVPVITLELPREASKMDTDELWDRYGQATLAAVVYPQSLEAK